MKQQKRGNKRGQATFSFFTFPKFKKVACPLFLCLLASTVDASEVIKEADTSVVVREHPKTGRPYVSIVPADIPPDPFSGQKKYSRPDYRMLDPKVKSGRIPYGGPYSDRTKIYVFAASLAALGTASGALVMAAAPAATGAAASGGAGAYLAGGTAVVAGSAAAAGAGQAPDPDKLEDYSHRSESKLVQEESGSDPKKHPNA